MSLNIRVIKDCNAFIDGDNYAGKSKSVTLPKLANILEDYRGAGMLAADQVRLGYEKLEAEITMGSFEPAVFAKVAHMTVSTVMEFRGALVNDADRSFVLTKIFKKESIGVISSLLSNLEGMEDIMGKLDDRTRFLGRSQQEYERQISGVNAKWGILGHKLEIMKIKFGDAFLPHVTAFLDKVAAGMDKLFVLMDTHPEAFKNIALATGGIFLLTSAVVGLGLAFSTVKMAMAGFNLGLANMAVRRTAARGAMMMAASDVAGEAVQGAGEGGSYVAEAVEAAVCGRCVTEGGACCCGCSRKCYYVSHCYSDRGACGGRYGCLSLLGAD